MGYRGLFAPKRSLSVEAEPLTEACQEQISTASARCGCLASDAQHDDCHGAAQQHGGLEKFIVRVERR